MIPKLAIEKAIEGGWMPYLAVKLDNVGGKAAYFFYKYNEEQSIPSNGIWLTEIALDPTFWQALGKALGWNEFEAKESWKNYATGEVLKVGRDHREAHAFYDLILTGGDTEAYWNELLK